VPQCAAGRDPDQRLAHDVACFFEVHLADALAIALEFDVFAEQFADLFAAVDGGDDEAR
jgi:hypothetical protein